jgi:hypothetical protein
MRNPENNKNIGLPSYKILKLKKYNTIQLPLLLQYFLLTLQYYKLSLLHVSSKANCRLQGSQVSWGEVK